MRTLDPRITQSRHEEMLIANMFDQLMSADSEGNMYPGPCNIKGSASLVTGGRICIQSSRDDVSFHDGTKFDHAAAVKAAFDSIVRSRNWITRCSEILQGLTRKQLL